MPTNSQQHHAMMLRGRIGTKPRRQFAKDFCEQFESKCNDQNEKTILIFDANECISMPERDGIMEIIKNVA
jgi:hypothetical protein